MNETLLLATNDWWQILTRLGAATIAGIAIGLDREWRGHDAGIRTHALVALSSAAIMLSSLLLYEAARSEEVNPDPLRAVQGLAQAIGFLVAGLIFVRQASVKNMTTAANLWMAAALGIACGAGQFKLAAVAAGITLVLLVLFPFVERLIPEKKDED
ncbi:MgtC/SapB family protein [Sphingomonas gilva]|uniref:MgtC/SapB family protein n=1 Tax=Sphingomonas gilva TaxID=2305907 RepID=UPI001FE250B2|nr:MgtC/SapB family protein [Sphingomonas gilva]